MITNEEIAQRAITVNNARNIGARESAAFDVKSLIVSSHSNFEQQLSEMEQKLDELSFEMVVLYTAGGVEFDRIKGQYDSVNISIENDELMRGGILTHNHPDGGFFSIADVRVAHKLDLIELRAVCKGNPTQVVSMRRPASGWNLTAFEKLIATETSRLYTAAMEQYIVKKRQSYSDEEATAYEKEWSRQEWIAWFPNLLIQLSLTWTTTRL